MNTHVFIVNEETFKIHLEYMFAGIRSKNREALFLIKSKENCHHSTEKIIMEMIPDTNKI